MNTLIVVATAHELDWFIKTERCEFVDQNRGQIKIENEQIDFVVTGMGIANTLINLPVFVKEYQPDLIVNAGLCGSNSEQYKIHETFSIANDCYADIAIIRENKKIFLHNDFTAASEPQIFFAGSDTTIRLPNIKTVEGVTVASFYNTPLNKRPDIYNKFIPGVESMEGAAVFQVAEMFQIKACSLRTVSNYVWQDQSEWDIPTAVSNNNQTLVKLIS